MMVCFNSALLSVLLSEKGRRAAGGRGSAASRQAKRRPFPCKARKLARHAAAPFPRKALALRGPWYRKMSESQVQVSAQGSHVGTSYARSDFLLHKKSVTRSTVPPYFAKSHAAPVLFACKRAHDAAACCQLFAIWNVQRTPKVRYFEGAWQSSSYKSL